MNKSTALVLSLLSIAIVSGAIAQQSPQEDKQMLKAVVHVNFEDSDRQLHGLHNIENILKDAPNTTMEVVCHGKGLALVTKKHSPNPELVATLIQQGVQFMACNNTMEKKAITKEDLIDGTSIVSSGAIEVIKKQSDGFSYFRP